MIEETSPTNTTTLVHDTEAAWKTDTSTTGDTATRHGVAAAGDLSALLPLGELRAGLSLVARFTLSELDQEEEIHRILDRAGDRAPDACERMLTDVLEPAYRALSELLQRWTGGRSALEDPDAVVMLLVGGLVNLRRNRWTFGRVPLDIDDDRAIAAWVETALGAVEHFSAK